VTTIETLLLSVASSQPMRFGLQLLILVALVVLGTIMLYDRFKTMQHRRATEAGEDYDMALDAKDRRLSDLAFEVAALRARETITTERVDAMQNRHDAEMEGQSRRFKSEMDELRRQIAELADIACLVLDCAKRKRPQH